MNDESAAVVLHLLSSPAVRRLLDRLRDRALPTSSFRPAAQRLCSLLAEASLAACCPCIAGACACAAVAVLRSGAPLAAAFQAAEPGMAAGGSLLLQRDEAAPGKQARLLLAKLPRALPAAPAVFLCDPMLATGGSACLALAALAAAGVDARRTLLVVALAAPEGLARVAREHPAVRVLAGAVDEGLDGELFIVPGLGDFGDRFFGT